MLHRPKRNQGRGFSLTIISSSSKSSLKKVAEEKSLAALSSPLSFHFHGHQSHHHPSNDPRIFIFFLVFFTIPFWFILPRSRLRFHPYWSFQYNGRHVQKYCLLLACSEVYRQVIFFQYFHPQDADRQFVDLSECRIIINIWFILAVDFSLLDCAQSNVPCPQLQTCKVRNAGLKTCMYKRYQPRLPDSHHYGSPACTMERMQEVWSKFLDFCVRVCG